MEYTQAYSMMLIKSVSTFVNNKSEMRYDRISNLAQRKQDQDRCESPRRVRDRNAMLGTSYFFLPPPPLANIIAILIKMFMASMYIDMQLQVYKITYHYHDIHVISMEHLYTDTAM